MPDDLKAMIQDSYASWMGINAVYSRWAKAHGLTYNTLFTLYFIQEYPKQCTGRFLCDKLLLPKQTVNSILEELDKKGYVVKQVMETDHRNKRIIFTNEGEEYAKEILTALYLFEERAVRGMNESDRCKLLETNFLFLDRLTQSLEEEKKL